MAALKARSSSPDRRARLRRVATVWGFVVGLVGLFVWLAGGLVHIQLVAHECLGQSGGGNPFTVAFGYFSPLPDTAGQLALALVVITLVLSLAGRPRNAWLTAASQAFATSLSLCAAGLALLLLVVWSSATRDSLGFLVLLPVFGLHVVAAGLLLLVRLRGTRWPAVLVAGTAIVGVFSLVVLGQPIADAFANVIAQIFPTPGHALVGLLWAGIAAGLAVLGIVVGAGRRRPAALAALLALPPCLALNAVLGAGYLEAFHSLCSWERDHGVEDASVGVAWAIFALVAALQIFLAYRRWRRSRGGPATS